MDKIDWPAIKDEMMRKEEELKRETYNEHRKTIAPTADEILQLARMHMKDRSTMYDNANGERSIGLVTELFNLISDNNLTEEDGWLFMLLLKIVRSRQGEYSKDSYEDGSAYFALMGEAAAKERI